MTLLFQIFTNAKERFKTYVCYCQRAWGRPGRESVMTARFWDRAIQVCVIAQWLDSLCSAFSSWTVLPVPYHPSVANDIHWCYFQVYWGDTRPKTPGNPKFKDKKEVEVQLSPEPVDAHAIAFECAKNRVGSRCCTWCTSKKCHFIVDLGMLELNSVNGHWVCSSH